MSFKIFGYSVNLSKKAAGNPISATNTKKRASASIKKQTRSELSYQIIDIKKALQRAKGEIPDRSLLFKIYEYISRDGHLKSQIRVAKSKVKAEPWMLYRNGKPDEAATERYNKIWFNKIIEYIIFVEWKGFAVIELDELIPGDAEVKAVKLINHENISIEQQRVLLEATINGPYIEYKDIAWDIDLLEFGSNDDYGSFLEAAYNVIWKYYGRSDWSRSSEKFGMPILTIEADTIDDTELDDMEKRAANFGADGYMVLQQGDKANILQRTGDNGHKIYLDNIELCNKEISKIINGQTGTTDEKAFVGGAEVHERTMEDITIDRLSMIKDEVNAKLLPYLEAKGFDVTGLTFDYPELIRIRQRRITGAPLATDPAKQPNDPDNKEEIEAKPTEEPENKK
jgi:phage gp29-like protein